MPVTLRTMLYLSRQRIIHIRPATPMSLGKRSEGVRNLWCHILCRSILLTTYAQTERICSASIRKKSPHVYIVPDATIKYNGPSGENMQALAMQA